MSPKLSECRSLKILFNEFDHQVEVDPTRLTRSYFLSVWRFQ